MSFISAISLSAVMLALAAMPSASVALVVTRSATVGIRNGVAVAIGIVTGDLLFVLLAILGMSFLAEAMGAFFSVLRMMGGVYLVWIGCGLLFSRSAVAIQATDCSASTLITSFSAGLLLTLGDVKAILFYASLFPSFVSMSSLNSADLLLIGVITVACVGGVKLAYAIAAERLLVRWRSSVSSRRIRRSAGGLMTGAGAYLIWKT